MEEKKKKTYYAESQKKYNAKNKIISCKVVLEKYEAIKKHAESKGYNSLNSYVLNLIEKDMKQ